MPTDATSEHGAPVLVLDELLETCLRGCGVQLVEDGELESELTAALESLTAGGGLAGCMMWLQERLHVDRAGLARELLRTYEKYDGCSAGNLSGFVGRRVLRTLLRSPQWREYVVYNLCGLVLYERLPIEFHTPDTIRAFEEAKRRYGAVRVLHKDMRYYTRHTTGQLREHGLGRGWCWSQLHYCGTVADLLWPNGGDDIAELEDDFGFYYESGIHLLTELGIDDAYIRRIFSRITTAGRPRTVAALLSLDYVLRHLAQEKHYAGTVDRQLKVARFSREYVTLWEVAEHGFLQYHHDTRQEGIDPLGGYLTSDFVHRAQDFGVELSTGELLNSVGSMVLEVFARNGDLVEACYQVWRNIVSWFRYELLHNRTTRTTGVCCGSVLWALTTYRHRCQEWAALGWGAAGSEIRACPDLSLRDEDCVSGLTNLFGVPYPVGLDGVTRSVTTECAECRDIQRSAPAVAVIAEGGGWERECERQREEISSAILHLTLCQQSALQVKREIVISLAWEYVTSLKFLSCMIGSVLCAAPVISVASDRPRDAVVQAQRRDRVNDFIDWAN